MKWLLRLFVLCSALSQAATSANADDALRSNPSVDARVVLASDAKNTIDLRAEQVNKSLTEILAILDKSLNDINEPLDKGHATTEGLLAATSILLDEGEKILSCRKKYEDNIASLRVATEMSPEVFRNAGQAYREYAESEPYESLQASYKTVASVWELRAKLARNRSKTIVPEKEILETLRFIERTVLFLARLKASLAAYPERDSEAEILRFKTQIKTYVHGFEQLRVCLKKYQQRLKDECDALDKEDLPQETQQIDPPKEKAPDPKKETTFRWNDSPPGRVTSFVPEAPPLPTRTPIQEASYRRPAPQTAVKKNDDAAAKAYSKQTSRPAPELESPQSSNREAAPTQYSAKPPQYEEYVQVAYRIRGTRNEYIVFDIPISEFLRP